MGKKEKQTELFPQLQAEIAKKRIELYKGVTWQGEKARRSADYINAMREAVKGKIGGTQAEQDFFRQCHRGTPSAVLVRGLRGPHGPRNCDIVPAETGG